MKLKIKSTSIKRIVFISLIFIIILGISTIAGNVKLNNVTIKLSNNQEIKVLTAKTNVAEILKENHIVVEDDETVKPGLEENISNTKTITVSSKDEEDIKLAENVVTEIDEESLINSHTNLTEKIEVVIEEIPFETVTKDVSNGAASTRNRVIQRGVNGQKKVTYKVTYKDDVETSREELSSEVIKEPVDKIVQVQSNVAVTSRASVDRSAVTGTVAEYQEYAKSRCADYGWSDYDFDCLVMLWNRESGWRVTAGNPYSGAYGIPQALPASKMASAGSDYMTNYKTQINWGLGYIKSRYGTPSNAWYH